MAGYMRSPYNAEKEASTSWSMFKSWFPQSLFLASFLSSPYIFDSAKLLVLGSIVETGRSMKHLLNRSLIFPNSRQKIMSMAPRTIPLSCVYFSPRQGYILFHILEYSMTAQFSEGDLAYEWIVHFLVGFPTLSDVSQAQYNFLEWAKGLATLLRLQCQCKKLFSEMGCPKFRVWTTDEPRKRWLRSLLPATSALSMAGILAWSQAVKRNAQ